MAESYIVCFAEEGKKNPVTLGPVVQECTGITRPDARRAVLKGHGLLAHGLSHEQAQGLVQALADEGEKAFCLAESAAPPVPRPVHVHRLSLEENGLLLKLDSRDRPAQVPWQALAAAICTQPKPQQRGSRTYKDAAFVPGAGAVTVQRTERPAQREQLVTATLALRNSRGDVRAFDLNRHGGDYSCLAERMAPSQGVNFSLLLQELARRAPHAFFTAGYLAVAGGNRRAAMRVDGERERLDYLRWAVSRAVASRR